MKLTGKCKEDFEKWYFGKPLHIKVPIEKTMFWTLKDSQKYGSYVDFFDGVEIYVTTSYDNHIKQFNWWVESENNYSGKELKRPDARDKAIKKANKIYNDKT